MKILLFYTVLFVSFVHSQNLPLFDLASCHNMCKASKDCPAHAACLPLFGSTQCGVCSCVIGYRPAADGSGCQPNIATSVETHEEETVDAHSGEETLKERSQEEMTSEMKVALETTVQPIVTPKTAQTQVVSSSMELKTGAEVAEPHELEFDPTFHCPKKNPDCDLTNAASNDPFTIKVVELQEDCLYEEFNPVQCPNNIGTNNDCAGGSICLELVKDHNTCACAYDRAGSTCRTLKPEGKCTDGNSTMLAQLHEKPGKRLVHKKIPLTGAIYARHIVPNEQHCAKLCEWAGGLRCQSFNYGRIDGKNVCELMSINSESDLLKDWLVDKPNFTHYCCYKFSVN